MTRALRTSVLTTSALRTSALRTSALRTSALLAAGLLSVAACGGSEDAGTAPAQVAAATTAAAASAPVSAEAKLTELVRSVVLADTVGNICRDKFSVRFATTMFGSISKCETAWAEEAPTERATGATVSDIQIDGLAATATVTEQGGRHEGIRGMWGFIRVGEDWRTAAWGVDYLRTMFAALYGPGGNSEQEESLFHYPAVRTCFNEKVQQRSDAAFRGLVQRLMRDEAQATEQVGKYLVACAGIRDRQGLTAMRRSFELGVQRQTERDGVRHLADCVTRRLRTSVSDRELGELVMTREEGRTSISRRIRHATFDCSL